MKLIKQIDLYKSIRKFWQRNPKTQVVPNKKKKSRQHKLELRKEE